MPRVKVYHAYVSILSEWSHVLNKKIPLSLATFAVLLGILVFLIRVKPMMSLKVAPLDEAVYHLLQVPVTWVAHFSCVSVFSA